MPRLHLPGRTLAVMLLLSLSATAAQRAAKPGTRQVIGTYQIDRYHAIEQVRADLLKDPKNLTDWVLLGELSQEVAMDAPPDRAPGYFRLARESFENAVKLDPKNPSLQAALRFAQDQEKGAGTFGDTRTQTTASYLATRRRELSQTNNAPSLRVYAPMTSTPASAPVAPASYPQYQSYVGSQGTPYTYQQHYDSFFGPVHPRTPDQQITATERAALVKPAARMAPP